MHILFGFLGIIAAAAIWWWRLKYLGEAATEVIDTVGRVRGNFRRKKLRKQAEMSPVTAIDDPVVAAATLIVAIHGEDQPLQPRQEAAIRETLAEIAPADKLDEAIIYGKWAASQIADTQLVIGHAGKFLSSRLNGSEKEQLVEMVNSVAATSGQTPQFLKLRTDRLRQKLGLMLD